MGITFSIHAIVDSTPVLGNVVDSGDIDADREVEKEIYRRLDMDDVWAWADVEVRATYEGYTGSVYLGNISCKNEDDFVHNSGYYEQMQAEAIDDLIINLRGIIRAGEKARALESGLHEARVLWERLVLGMLRGE
jgi:hypothetical protein